MVKFFIILFSFFTILRPVYGQFTLMGSQLDGNSPNDNFGWSVALDDKGQTLVVGAPLYDNDFGQVRVYKESGGVWMQIGGDLNGDEIGHQFGFSTSLSSNGRRMALSGLSGNVSTREGHARVYDLKNGQWQQAGNTIIGEAAGDQFGFDIELNGNGNRIVIGATRNNGNGVESGQAKVYEFQNNDWVQIGQDIDGENAGDLFGISVSISKDGNIIAVGSANNSGAANGAGHVRLYQWKNNNWEQLGNDIEGQNENENLGLSVTLNDDGSLLATSATGHDHGAGFGSVRVFEFANNSWTQLGNDIQGTSNMEAFGQAVNLNGSGNRIVIGTQSSDEFGLSSGRANVYTYENGAWSELFSPILGKASFDYVGKSVALNKEGNRIAIGANLANATQGYAVVYEDSQMPVGINEFVFDSKFYTVSVPRHLTLHLESNFRTNSLEVEIYNLLGQLEIKKQFSSQETVAIRHQLAAGVYTLRLKVGSRVGTKKVMIY